MITLLDNRYRLLRKIGSGSEGNVYLALQESTQKFLAVKEISKQGACYSREGVEVWKRLHHPHLPEILDLIETEEQIWVVMEYVEGITLSEWIREHGAPHEFLLFRWLLDICDTLEYLHGQDPPVIFGDLKPENILIHKEDPILVDLGSVYVKGSKGKRTGTYDSGKMNTGCETEHDIFCLGKTLEQILPKMNKRYRRFARRAMGLEWPRMRQVCDCKRYLSHVAARWIGNIGMLFLTAALLIAAGSLLKKEEVRAVDEKLILEAEQLLEEKLSDQKLDESEYIAISRLWEKTDENGRKRKDNCRELPKAYGTFCYQVGVACWDSGEEWGGRQAAKGWFLESAEVPGEWQENSKEYLKQILLEESKDEEE